MSVSSFISRTAALLRRLAKGLSHISAAAVCGMMLVTCIDVVLRKLRLSIPGAYETVEFLSAVFVSFSLALTSLEKGHIAVNFLVQRFPGKTRDLIEAVNLLLCTGLFAKVTCYMYRYGADLKSYGEVSMTLQIPVYPFVWGVACGIGVLSLILMFQFVEILARRFFGYRPPESSPPEG
ncbi:MAG: hypothetical protein CSA22_00445 [Deltaproteobacteria bacterium]|nr:MAG: hypothetical protein CSA22_00445 [Deltaproteobacteria bacterium]